MNRRKFFGFSIASALTFSTIPLLSNCSGTKKQRIFRIFHLTDMHLFPHQEVEKKMKILMQKMNSFSDKPDFILNTGDNVMDSLKRSKDEVQKQWDSWDTYFHNKINIPMYSCIGNHDVWGWGLKDESVKNDPLYGKNWAKKKLGLKERYYSFDHKGWKFICLDSPFYADNEHAYTAKLDDEQFLWLQRELENTNHTTPVVIASHIPILSSSVFFDGNNNRTGNWNIPGSWMHIDAIKIKNLLYKYKNVKAALSGHVHLADKTDYLGVNYHCNGAVCGGWWRGSYQEFAPAFAMVDFFNDGSVQSTLVPYED